MQNQHYKGESFGYIFILAALNLRDARRAPFHNPASAFKKDFCSCNATQAELCQINQILSELTEDEFEILVLGHPQEAEQLILQDPKKQITYQFLEKYEALACPASEKENPT